MGVNPLLALNQCGQSVWLDNISRGLITGGELQRLIKLDGVTGVTSNPTIFAKALNGRSEYDDSFNAILRRHPEMSNAALAERLMIEDIQMAADLLRPVFDGTQGADGFVSLEVSPACAGNTEATIAEARRLWFDAARLNVMIKVPATSEGIPAVETLIAQGINVNITLMFSLDHYEAVAKAYLHGLSGHQGACADGSRLPTRDTFIVGSWRSFMESRSRIYADEAREFSGRSGRARGRKIRLIPMSSTSRDW